MDTQKILHILSETLNHSAYVLDYTNSPIHLQLYNKQNELFEQIKDLLMTNPDKHEIFKLGLIFIELSNMIDENYAGVKNIPTYH